MKLTRAGLLMAAATLPGGVAGPPPELYPDPTVATSGNYTLNTPTTVSFSNPGLTYADNGNGCNVTLAGAAATALNALSSSVAYVVRLTVANWVGGSVQMRLKSGTRVEFNITGNGVWTKTVTTGTGSIHDIPSSSVDGDPGLKITGISVKTA